MDKETLSNYGWVVICILVLIVMIALATPFGTFIKEAVTNAVKALYGAAKSSAGTAGLTLSDPTAL